MALDTASARPRRSEPLGSVTLGPLSQLRAGRLPRRLGQLYVGLVLYGCSVALMVRGDLGLSPWDVLHSGLTRYLPLDLGQVIVAVSVVVLLLWVPLREMPGLGTISNALVIGLSADLVLSVVDRPDATAVRVAYMLLGVVLCGLATAGYIGARLGSGPRDGLMTGLHRRTGVSLRLVRTGLEVTVVLIGVLLGGRLGVGTVLFAVTIGPLTQAFLPLLTVSLAEDGR